MPGRTALLQVLIPVALGIAIGIVILLVSPGTGKNIGGTLYTANREAEGYAYAVAIAAPSVVNIYVTRLNKNYSYQNPDHNDLLTSASGVIMRRDGFIVTNYHVITSVIRPNTTIFAQLYDDTILPAFVVGYDRRTDIAVLKVQADDLSPARLDGDYEPRVGDIVLAIGNPNNLGQTVTHGIISSTDRSGTGLLTRDQMHLRDGSQDLIQTDAPINRGNSGGALVNTNGALVGINTASFSANQSHGISFAVPSHLVVRVMEEIIAHGRVVRGYVGIADDGIQQLPDVHGIAVRVGYIDPSGPAAATELQVGDLITGVDGAPIDSLRSLIERISQTAPGTVMQLEVRRGGEVRHIEVELTEDQGDIS